MAKNNSPQNVKLMQNPGLAHLEVLLLSMLRVFWQSFCKFLTIDTQKLAHTKVHANWHPVTCKNFENTTIKNARQLTRTLWIWHVVWQACEVTLRWYFKKKCTCRLTYTFLFLKTSRDTLDLKLNVKWHTLWASPRKTATVCCPCNASERRDSHTNSSRRNYLNSDSQNHHRLRCAEFSPPGVTIDSKWKQRAEFPENPVSPRSPTV